MGRVEKNSIPVNNDFLKRKLKSNEKALALYLSSFVINNDYYKKDEQNNIFFGCVSANKSDRSNEVRKDYSDIKKSLGISSKENINAIAKRLEEKNILRIMGCTKSLNVELGKDIIKDHKSLNGHFTYVDRSLFYLGIKYSVIMTFIALKFYNKNKEVGSWFEASYEELSKIIGTTKRDYIKSYIDELVSIKFIKVKSGEKLGDKNSYSIIVSNEDIKRISSDFEGYKKELKEKRKTNRRKLIRKKKLSKVE